jgi:hypothetical protein
VQFFLPFSVRPWREQFLAPPLSISEDTDTYGRQLSTMHMHSERWSLTDIVDTMFSKKRTRKNNSPTTRSKAAVAVKTFRPHVFSKV